MWAVASEALLFYGWYTSCLLKLPILLLPHGAYDLKLPPYYHSHMECLLENLPCPANISRYIWNSLPSATHIRHACWTAYLVSCIQESFFMKLPPIRAHMCPYMALYGMDLITRSLNHPLTHSLMYARTLTWHFEAWKCYRIQNETDHLTSLVFASRQLVM